MSESNEEEISLSSISDDLWVEEDLIFKIADYKEKMISQQEQPNEQAPEEVTEAMQESANGVVNGDEAPKKAKNKGIANNKLKGILNANNAKTAFVAGMAVGAVIFLIANLPMAAMIGAGALIVKEEIKKGKR